MRKLGSLLLSMVIFLSLFGQFEIYAETERAMQENMHQIATAEDFLAFAKAARYDEYTRGQVYVLTNDITLSQTQIVPIFLGQFDGNGHTIYVEEVDKNFKGIFGLIETSGEVLNLEVHGEFDTTNDTVGGIASENKGYISDCVVRGVVKGATTVGGIVAKNSGTIVNSQMYGYVMGTSTVGGVVGENHGSVIQSDNYANINRENVEVAIVDSVVESDIIDIGGVAGSSVGILQNCNNYGDVGYPHIGYNHGGIVGKQSGLVVGCNNYGDIYGRKEVGGIVGQFEPYVLNVYSMTKLAVLRTEIDKLTALTTNLSTNTRGSSAVLSAQIDNINQQLQEAKEETGNLIVQTEDLVNANVDVANEISVTITDLISDFADISDDVLLVSKQIQVALDDVEEAMKHTYNALRDLGKVESLVDSTVDALDRADDHLQSAKYIVDKIAAINPRPTSLQEISSLVSLYFTYFKELSDELHNAVDDVQFAVGYMQRIVGVVGDANEDVQEAVLCAIDAVDNLQITLEFVDIVIEKVGDALKKAGAEEKIFYTTDVAYADTQARLGEAIDGVTDEISNLNIVASESMETLLLDMDAINLQLNVVLNLLIEIIQDTTNATIGSVIEIEDKSSYKDVTAGKIAECTNEGNVSGDINIGGVVGAISFESFFDREDDFKLSDTQTVSREGNAVVFDCQNTGDVTAKKDGAGGIVGMQEFGIIATCTATGYIKSSDGNYVGGIVGKSNAVVNETYAKAHVMGNNYVGGIAGSGNQIQNSYGISEVVSEKSHFGGIAGMMTDTFLLKENYFVHRDLGGVDGISYKGKAEEISYEVLHTIDSEFFQALEVMFVVDDLGETLLLRADDVSYEMQVGALDFPEIPKKEGYYGVWEEIGFEDVITTNRTYEASYIRNLSTLASEEKEEVLSKVLVDGEFTNDHIIYLDEDGDTYQVRVPSAEFEMVRFLNVYEKSKIEMMQNGKWVTVPSEVDGKYTVFSVVSTDEITFREIELMVEDDDMMVLYIGIGSGGAIIALILLSQRKKSVA